MSKTGGKKTNLFSPASKNGTKNRKLMFFAQWFVPVLQNHKLVNTAVKSHLYKNLIRKKSMQKKKRVRNMLFIFTKEKKIGTILHIAFSIKPVAHFAGLGSRSQRARSPRTPRHSALSTEPSHARKTWIQEKAQNHAPPAFPNINNNQRSGKKKKKNKNKKQKRRTKKRIGQECH